MRVIVIATLLLPVPAVAQTVGGPNQTFKPAPPASADGAAPAPDTGAAAAPSPPSGPPGALPRPLPPGSPPQPGAAPPSPSPPGYPPAGPPPGGYPPAGYPPGGYPPGYAPPPGYPPGGYPPGAYPPSGYPPAGYPYGAPYAPYGGYPYRQVRAPGAETHDGGYVRLQFGIHSLTMTGKNAGDTVEYSGSGASLAVAGGYSVTPHLIVFAEALIAGDADVDAKLNGGNSSSTHYGVNVEGIGPGLAFYFGPNLFVAASLLLAQTTIDNGDGNTLLTSKSGFAVDATVGKEWWVSDNWGLGISGQMLLSRTKGKDPDVVLGVASDYSALGFSLLFSATYN